MKAKLAPGRERSVHYSTVLTNIAVEFTPPELIARTVFPVVDVEKAVDLWPVFDKTAFNDVDDIRADGDESNQATRGWRYDAYICETHSLNDVVTAKMRKNWDSDVDLESSTNEFLKQLIMNRIEVRWFGTNGIIRKTANNIYNQNLDWTNASTADVKGGLDAAAEAIEVASGKSPNTLVLTPTVGRAIANTAQWKDYYKYTTMVANQGLPDEIYGYPAKYVKSLINTSNKGQGTNLARIMSDDVWLGYIDPSPRPYKTVTYGINLQTYEESRKWFESSRNGDVIEYEIEYCPKVVAKECGALLQSVLTS